MKTCLPLFALLLLLTGCAPTTTQLVTLSSNNLQASPKQGFVYETDTLRLNYQFFSERGVLHLTIENKLNKPLYIDWKRSAFIVGKDKMDYWVDESVVNLTGTGSSLAYTRFWNHNRFDINGTIRKSNPVDYIPPGTRLERDQFVIVPGQALLLPGQFAAKSVPPTTPWQRKPVSVQTYAYSAETSPLTFRNYLTLSADKEFGQEFVLDSKFWASDVQVMPYTQLTGGQDWSGNQEHSSNLLRNTPYYRADAFYLTYTPTWSEPTSLSR